MKIGIDARGLLSPQKTGLEWYEVNFIKALARIDPNNQYILYFNKSPKEMLPFNFKKRILFWPLVGFNQFRLPLDFLFFKPDVFFFPVLVRPFYCPCKSVVLVHDLNFLFYPRAYSFLSRNRLALTVKIAVLRSDRIIAPSHSTKKDIVEFYQISPSKINVIYEGYDKKVFSPAPLYLIRKVRNKYNLSEPYLVHIAGRFLKYKNTEALIEAFSLVKKRHKIRHKLIIVGKKDVKDVESRYLPSLKLVERLKIDKEVIFLGYLPLEDLPPLLSGASASISPSLYEGFGLPVLESMACGVPVIASAAASIPEIVKDAGILINPQSPQELAHAIYKVLKSPALSIKLRKKGLKRASEFSWEKCAKETLLILEEVGSR